MNDPNPAEEEAKAPYQPVGRTLDQDPEGLTNYTLPDPIFKPEDYKFIALSGNYPQSIREALKHRKNWKEIEDETEAIESAHLMWRPCNYGSSGFSKLTERKKASTFPLIYNHFEYIRCIWTKTGLVKTLKKYYEENKDAVKAGYSVFHSTPSTYIADETTNNTMLQRKLIRHVEKILPQKHCQKNLWLVKPEGLNRGRGIEVFNNIKDIMNFVCMKGPKMRYVIQKYIEKPMLYHQRKFDIRVWALFQANEEKVYYYKRGYVRTSSDEFTHKIGDNKAVHLTNNCFQQHLDNYGKFEDGNTISFEKLQQYLDETFPDDRVNVYDHFIKRMKDIVIDVFWAAKAEFNKNNRDHAFELFGFDFMIDEDFGVWLIECNTNPYLGIPNDFIADLLPRMISEMFEIVLDPVYPPKWKWELPEKNFELIYSPEKNTRRPFDTPTYEIKTPERYNPNVIRPGVRSRLRKSRGNQGKRNLSMTQNKNPSIPRSVERHKKAVSSLRKTHEFRSINRKLEKAYLSSGSGKTKSPAMKKSSKFDLSNRKPDSKKRTTITPRASTRKNNLQLSVSVLTNELLTGKANGEYKIKSFQMVMNRILHKISLLNTLLNKPEVELSGSKTQFLKSSLPSINEKENMPTEEEDHMAIKDIKADILDPVWSSLFKLSKSKYIVKVSEADGVIYLSKFLKELKNILGEQDWGKEDERKEQREWKITLVHAILETITTILKNDRVRCWHLNGEYLDILINTFMWCEKYKAQPQPFPKIHEILINLMCDLINTKSGKYFIPSGHVSEAEKVKKLAISHGVLALLYFLFNDEGTEYTTKRVINTKILAFVSKQDLQSQIDALEELEKGKEVKEVHKTPKKSISRSPGDKEAKSGEPGLEITGSGYKSTSPKHSEPPVIKGKINQKIKEFIDFDKIKEIFTKEISSLEAKNTKMKVEDQLKKKESKRQLKESKDKRFKAKRYLNQSSLV